MLHDALRLIRVCHDYSIDKTALLTGIDASDIANIECGELDISEVMIDKYAAGFEMSKNDIMFFSEAQMPGETKLSRFARGQFTGGALRFLNWINTNKKGER